MIRRIEEKLIKIGEKEAEKLLAFNTFESQRPLKKKHVDDLVKAIRGDLFLVGDVALAKLNYNGGRTVLVNGQHQCSAVVEAESPISVHFHFYSVDNPFELSTLYRQFDNHAARTLNDAIRPEAAALKIEWPSRVQTLLVTAASLRECNANQNKHDKIPLLSKYRQHGDFIASILAPKGALFVHSKHALQDRIKAVK